MKLDKTLAWVIIIFVGGGLVALIVYFANPDKPSKAPVPNVANELPQTLDETLPQPVVEPIEPDQIENNYLDKINSLKVEVEESDFEKAKRQVKDMLLNVRVPGEKRDLHLNAFLEIENLKLDSEIAWRARVGELLDRLVKSELDTEE